MTTQPRKQSPGFFGWIGIVVGISFGLLALYGLVTGGFSSPLPQQETSQAVTITASDTGLTDINLWSSPTNDARVVGVVRAGDTVQLIARSAESDRVEVRTHAGLEGWLNKGFIGEQ